MYICMRTYMWSSWSRAMQCMHMHVEQGPHMATVDSEWSMHIHAHAHMCMHTHTYVHGGTHMATVDSEWSSFMYVYM